MRAMVCVLSSRGFFWTKAELHPGRRNEEELAKREKRGGDEMVEGRRCVLRTEKPVCRESDLAISQKCDSARERGTSTC